MRDCLLVKTSLARVAFLPNWGHCHTQRLTRRILALRYSHLLPSVKLKVSEDCQSNLSEIGAIERTRWPPSWNELTGGNEYLGVTAAEPFQ